MDDNSLKALMSDPRVREVKSFDDLPAIRQITRFEAWALADEAGLPYPNGATRDEVVAILERAIGNGLNIAAVATRVLEKAQKRDQERWGPAPLPVCIICGETIDVNQAHGEGRNGKFHLACAGFNQTVITPTVTSVAGMPAKTDMQLVNGIDPKTVRIGTLRRMAKEQGHTVTNNMTKKDFLTLLGM